MTKKIIHAFSTVSMVIATVGVNAQTTPKPLRSDTFIVVKDYRPQLADAVKVKTDAPMPAPDTARLNLSYSTNPQLKNVPYTPATLRPIAMSRETDNSVLQNNYVKAGFGTQWSPLLDAHFSNGRNEKLYYAVNGFYHSANGADKYKNFIDGLGSATVKLPGKKLTLISNASFENKSIYYYAFDQGDSSLLHGNEKGLVQRFNAVHGDFSVENSVPGKIGLNYKLKVADRYFFSSRNYRENHFSSGLYFDKQINDIHKVGLNVDFNLATPTFIDSTTTYVYVPISPYYEYKSGLYYARAGVVVAPGTKTLVYPNIYGQVNLANGKFLPYIQASGYTKTYFVSDLARMNPWINESTQQAFGKTIELKGGFKGSIADRWSYAASVGYTMHDNLPIFIAYDQPVVTFMTYYEQDAGEVNPHVELAYHISDKAAVTLQGDYYKYILDYNAPAYGYNDWKITFGGHYNMSDKILFKANLKAHPATEQLYYVQSENALGLASIKGWVDGNVEAIYNYKSNYAGFISLNNIAASPYARWYRYRGYGFNMKAGIILKF